MFFFVIILLFLNCFFYFYLLEWFFFSLKFSFYFNNLLFSLILLAVTLCVLLFRSYYLNGEIYFFYYLFVLMIFVFRMFSLNFSNNSLSMLLSWDLLGISSFFLVLFYNNWDSCNGAINTVLTNRLGDYFIFVFFSYSFFINFNFFSYGFLIWSSVFFLILTAFTKSAQFPFRGWLPKAIRAPTPVRSLVHRRTLVTAGLLLLFNFSFVLMNYYSIILIFFVGIFTTFFSRISAVAEEDIKKVVALRTLSQMGFSMTTLGLGVSFISLVHLLRHALFKSCLFLQVGYLIHCSFGQQDGRFYGFLKFIPFFVQLQLLVTLFCLCGLFFFSGLVSKDLILESFFSSNWYLTVSLFFFFTVYLTFFYSYRLWKALFSNFSSVFIHYRSSYLINFLRLIVCLGSIFFIWWLTFNLLVLPSFFVFIDFYVPLFYLFFFFFIINFFYKFISWELIYKFLSDYFPKFLVYFFKSSKFFENFFYSLSGVFVSNLFFFRNFFNFFFYRNFYNSLVFLVFLLFVFIWGYILYKNIWFAFKRFFTLFIYYSLYFIFKI